MRTVEIKAVCRSHDPIREWLMKNNAEFRGVDHQIDTYFHCTFGRLKIREGEIENALIQYNRNNQAGPKKSEITLVPFEDGRQIIKALKKSLGVLTVVDKMREIYFVDHVKIHLDRVKRLGKFVEIEVIDCNDARSLTEMESTCHHYMDIFGISVQDLVEISYSDMMINQIDVEES